MAAGGLAGASTIAPLPRSRRGQVLRGWASGGLPALAGLRSPLAAFPALAGVKRPGREAGGRGGQAGGMLEFTAATRQVRPAITFSPSSSA